MLVCRAGRGNQLNRGNAQALHDLVASVSSRVVRGRLFAPVEVAEPCLQDMTMRARITIIWLP